MPRTPNTAERRRQIVIALHAVMAEHGYERASIQAIARQAGLAPGLIHYHFKNKEEILLELVKTLADVAQARYSELTAQARSPDERLKAFLDARLGTGAGADPQAVAAWVMVGAEAVRQPQVRQAYQQVLAAELAQLQGLLTACLADRGKTTARVSLLAASLLAFMEGAFQLASAARELMPREYAAGMALRIVDRFIDAEPTSDDSPGKV
ncbi:TetR/AcrR family transcriptional regulator [Massilia norwichensis]|jgi:TetR/AcrR family transcriptional regulator, transcriptional repressor of bet genes|uniref:TetR/AcrR family transcriptional regulator n=1 Tax=Massilia norwichensis TaxID=1442366 RepID=A0ABT2A621_9BURK|nr:TetR/AcrR family transcriptional regulator [Massilia norwichensis]MCS0589618.1 TetR/AcrR family transcriptional regulator [Massilia norwichensis]